MSSAQFKLDMFEGPLDLLLHLISKHKLNIHDIEISLLLEQYLEYMHQLDHEDLEDAADFLEMAARLIYIKTVSLLPQDEEAVELKKELEGRLIEYSQCKLLANELGKVYAGGNIFVRKPVAIPVDKTYAREHDPQVLLEAYLGLSEKARNEKPINAKIFQPIVSYKVVSVGSKIVYILKKLYTVGVCDLSHIYDDMETKSERVAAFLAVLELTKSGRICLNDDNTQIFFSEKSRKRKKHHDTAPNVPSDDELPGEAAQEELSPVQQEGNAPLSQQKPLTQIVQHGEPVEKTFVQGKQDAPEAIQPHDAFDEQDQAEALQEEVPAKDNDPKSDYKEKNAPQLPLQEKMEKNSPSEENIPAFIPDDVVYLPADNLKRDKPKTENRPVRERVRESSELIYKPAAVKKTAAEKPDYEQIVPQVSEPAQEEFVPGEREQTGTDKVNCGFKPNYWNRLRWYWARVSVGDDAVGNYWRYGKS